MFGLSKSIKYIKKNILFCRLAGCYLCTNILCGMMFVYLNSYVRNI